MAVRAGCPELRKAMRRFPGLSLTPTGSHAAVCGPDGRPLRLPDGRKLIIPCSPTDGDGAARALVRQLRSLGIRPRRAA